MARHLISVTSFLVLASAVAPGQLSPLQAQDLPAGRWSERTQLVVDPENQMLVRRRVKVWSPPDLADLKVTWRPNVGSGLTLDGVAQGYGTLSWNEPDAAAHDATAFVASYVGEVRAGRPHGYGRYQHRSGLSFDGIWQRGSMSGSGVLKTPDGMDYAGQVKNGVPHGTGRQFVDGTLYDGSFANGMRNGYGALTRFDGEIVQGLWLSGQLIDSRPVAAAGTIQLAQVVESSQATISVYANRQQNLETEKHSTKYGAGAVVLYEQEQASGALRLRPRVYPATHTYDLMGIWKGNAAVGIDDLDSTLAFGPAHIGVEIRNTGKSVLQIVDGYLEVDESVTDLQPLLALNSRFDTVCVGEEGLDPDFSINNYGWGPAENATVTYNFARNPAEDNSSFRIKLGTFLDSQEVSVLAGLQELGVDIKRLKTGTFACASRAAISDCLKKLAGSGLFGNLPLSSIRPAAQDSTSISAIFIVTDVSGHISYSWKDTKGASHDQRSPLKIEIPLFVFKIKFRETMAECGAGGPEDTKHLLINLRPGQANYRLPLQYRATINPGQIYRLGLSVSAPRASQHRFRAVMRLSDGSVVRSTPLDLLFFRPRPAKEASPDDKSP